METIDKVIKRDGRVVGFSEKKIAAAVLAASSAIGKKDAGLANDMAAQVRLELSRDFAQNFPTVEDIQNYVEKALIDARRADIAKTYILYRAERTQLRKTKQLLGVTDDLKLTVNAVEVLNRRYLAKDDQGKVIETPKRLFERVAAEVASVDQSFGQDARAAEADFFAVMAQGKFLPNSPTLMNAGTNIGQLSACFVLPVEDSIIGIFDSLKDMALIHKSGGGTGFSFSRIRPAGDIVKTTAGVSSGPLSFIKIYDAATDVIKQGGRRRGANMGVLRVDHPDVRDFITAKERGDALTNFNLSVAVTDDFMDAVEKNEDYWLISPRQGRRVKKLKARSVFDLIATMAWRTGDPGLIFIDEINRTHPLAKLGDIESTNPCGELPLLPFESCNLGSINLTKMIAGKTINWDELGRVTELAVHFLDNVIDAGKFPLPEIAEITRANRKIGLGVMGFAEMLTILETPYMSDATLKISEDLSRFIRETAIKASVKLAKKRGSFPNFESSIWKDRGFRELRNATLTTIAPTGTISIIAGTSSGIEPLFAITYIREALGGLDLLETNSAFERVARERDFFSEELTHV
ncbi:MAG TPA: adenosylcobalamin-dependent ribonucleoside-diphosphate reductase, partial [Actinobacteria bacterium]|nr:adenosylcobalamin-dependent ribonucleoside-diphosphate reductase [Actinomycetota bacterium]